MLTFRGATENLEGSVAWIDPPILDQFYIFLSPYLLDRRVMVLDTPHLIQFISCISKLQAFDEASIGFHKYKL